ncbi:hypothetical protein K435DRAFT_858444 [Dendrothele bispora CBS 962.96]|uniref:DUF659 domain-containing protein n=1 Tax=Dendrothele bispora (strain CBS 962.96) TaxID=1314807 RepID=A0A4S8M4C4_DENBC|nr:hypothetical protein K435DRAFT_858444 [Dendrothele bispora CBS 962.96]
MSSSTNPLWEYFHKGEQQNSTQHKTWCKACVKYYQDSGREELEERIENEDEATKYHEREKAFRQRSVRGEKLAFITHILGSHREKNAQGCPYACNEAKMEAQRQRDGQGNAPTHNKTTTLKRHISTTISDTPVSTPASKKLKQAQLKTYNALEMPFSDAEIKAIQAQALRAQVLSKAPEIFFEDPEVLKLLGMLRKGAVSIMPTAKVLGGHLLDDAAAQVERKLEVVLKGQDLGMLTDQWKSIKKDSIAASYTIELLEVTVLNKDGTAQCSKFEKMIDNLESRYSCKVLFFVTDADGGSKKRRIELGKKCPYLVLPSCWAHQFQLQLGDYFKVYEFGALIAEDATFLIGWLNNHGKVQKIFDSTQEKISKSRYTFIWLHDVKDSLQLAVLKSRAAIIAAHVGAAKSTEKQKLEAEAKRACDLIADGHDRPYSFWQGLESVIGDLELICLATNITQKGSVRPDQVLLNIAGIYLHFSDHPEPELSGEMVKRIEKQWKDCDQAVFLSALILNSYEKLSGFGPRAGLNQFKIANIIVWLYQHMNLRPDNEDSLEERKFKKKQVTNAVYLYLSTTGSFADFESEQQNFESTMGKDPIAAWNALAASPEVKELSVFAIKLFKIVANSAGCESKLHKVGSDIHMENQNAGLVKIRGKWNIHKLPDIGRLLDVPQYSNLLDDIDHEDESERGQLLVTSPKPAASIVRVRVRVRDRMTPTSSGDVATFPHPSKQAI